MLLSDGSGTSMAAIVPRLLRASALGCLVLLVDGGVGLQAILLVTHRAHHDQGGVHGVALPVLPELALVLLAHRRACVPFVQWMPPLAYMAASRTARAITKTILQQAGCGHAADDHDQ